MLSRRICVRGGGGGFVEFFELIGVVNILFSIKIFYCDTFVHVCYVLPFFIFIAQVTREEVDFGLASQVQPSLLFC